MLERQVAEKGNTQAPETTVRHHEDEEAQFSGRVLEQIRNPTHRGEPPEADAQATFTGWCGDTMTIFLQVDEGRIFRVSFTTDGCGSAIACGSMLASMSEGLTVSEAAAIQPPDVIRALDGMPESNAHCANLAVKTLRKALEAGGLLGPDR
jgi:nitrogen fixation NifU-like protein